MCIRDRLQLIRLDLDAGAIGRLEELRVGGGDAVPAQRVQAVSYTHLRAHETVLDLVCRLLLEKKKKYKTTQQ